MTTTTATRPKRRTYTRPTSPHPCECGTWSTDTASTGCTKQVNRQFAQGHDQKLKSLLVAAGVADQKLYRTVGDVAETFTCEEAAARFSFAWQVRDYLARRLAKGQKKAEVKPPRAAKVKVGRWVYDAQVTADGTATYKTSKGETKKVPAGQFTEV